MRTLFATTAALAVAGPACAQDIKLTPLIDGRVRYEHVDQDGIARDADALTVRVRGGVQATSGPWSTLIEAQGTLAAIDDYYDGVQGAATRPLVADPENVALYRAQLQYRTKALAVTAGRQRIVLDDERFVGNVAFRDNGQTFDAVRAEVTAIPKLKLDVSGADWSASPSSSPSRSTSLSRALSRALSLSLSLSLLTLATSRGFHLLLA